MHLLCAVAGEVEGIQPSTAHQDKPKSEPVLRIKASSRIVVATFTSDAWWPRQMW
jgi:hypothetical protein